MNILKLFLKINSIKMKMKKKKMIEDVVKNVVMDIVDV